MDGFGALLGNWHFWALAIGYYAAMAVISGMPAPEQSSTRGYVWAYNSLHVFSANIKQVVGNKLGNGTGNGGTK